MDISTGNIYHGNDAVEKAFLSGKIKNMDNLIALPEEIREATYFDTSGNHWVQPEKLFQCAKCKDIVISYEVPN